MSTTIKTRLDETQDPEGSAGVERSEPPRRRAQRRPGAARRPDREFADRVREVLPDGVIDGLLAGARTEEEIVGHGWSAS